MKKFTTLFAVVTAFVLFSCGVSTKDAIKYNDQLTNEVNTILNKYNAFTQSSGSVNHETGDYSAIDKPFAEYKAQVEASEKIVNEMKAFDGKTEMKDVALKLITTCKSTMNGEWAEMISIVKKGVNMTEDDATKLKDLGTKVDEQMAKVQQDFIDNQKKFAAQYKFELSTK